MSRPMRVKLSRKKGWKIPPNTINVARPTKWGNPFPVAEYGRDVAVIKYMAWLRRQYLDGVLDPVELRGKNLACWCPIDARCHADVLLTVANNE